MIAQCEYCTSKGTLIKRLPFGAPLEQADTLVILPANMNLMAPEKQGPAVKVYPTAHFVNRYACMGVDDVEKALVGCGTMIRWMVPAMRIIILPKSMTDEFLGLAQWGIGLKVLPSGQHALAYDDNPFATEIVNEYERLQRSFTAA